MTNTQRPDLYAYEAEQRRRIAERDWAKVHILGDKAKGIQSTKRRMNMTQKQRRLVYEVIAIGAAGILGAFAVPALLSDRNSVSTLAGFLLLLGWGGWLAWYLYRARNLF